jgi:uncharacterized membrane protein
LYDDVQAQEEGFMLIIQHHHGSWNLSSGAFFFLCLLIVLYRLHASAFHFFDVARARASEISICFIGSYS